MCLDDFTIDTIERNLQTVDFRTPVETLALSNVEAGQHDRAQILIDMEFHQDIPPPLSPACGYFSYYCEVANCVGSVHAML